MTEFTKWVAWRATPLLVVCLFLALAAVQQAEATIIRDLRIGHTPGYVRMVLEFDRPLKPSPSVSIDHQHLQISLTGIVNSVEVPRIGAQTNGIIGLDVAKTSGDFHIDAVYDFAPADVKTFTLTGPHRYIIDVYRPLPADDANPLFETLPRIPSDINRKALPRPYPAQGETASAGLSNAFVEASLDAYGVLASNRKNAPDLQRHRLQQRLIAALIVVTSIIIVLLFFLLWIGSDSRHPGQPSWRVDLPPADDQEIDSIDAKILDHLKTYDDA